MSQQSQSPDEQLLSLPDFNDNSPDDQDTLLPPRPPWWRRRRVIIVIAVILLLVLLGGLLFPLIRGRNRTNTYQFQKVTQGDFSLSINATGPLQSSVYNLTFTGTGKITEIDVKVGQTVKKNQVLAQLDKTSLQDAVDQAQAGVLTAQTAQANAQANFNKIQAQSLASVQAALTALTNAQADLSTTQAQSQASIAAAQTALSDDQTNLSNMQTQSQASIAAAQTALSNDQTNLSQTQATAQAQINLARTQEQQAISNCNSRPTPTPTSTSTPPPNCVQLAQDQYNQAVAQANASVAAAQAKVNSDQQQLALTRAQANANNTAAQAKVNSDQQQLASATAQANSNNTTAHNQISTAMSQFATAQANANANNTNQQGLLNTAQSQLQTALVQLETAKHSLDNAILTAPHDGIITIVNGTVGGTPSIPASSTATVATGGTFIQITDISSLQVQANVNESDTANLKVGDPVQFTVSAYGNQIFRGTVTAIPPIGQTVSNVVTYPVTIDVDMNRLQGVNLLPGMTANVTIIVVQRPTALLIPVNAVNFARTATGTVNGIPPLITKEQANAVLAQARQMLTELQIENPSILQDSPIPAYVLERPGGQSAFMPVPVVLGLTDDTFYEVLKGLSVGEIIVVGARLE